MPNSKLAIRVEKLGKCYHIYKKPQDRIKQILACGRKEYFQKFWALENINFEVKKGDAIGIIGRNGSGKSTLLQLLCKTLTATTGKIEVNGKIAALLELGAGFNPEFSGRENVYLNGAILGFNRKEIDQRFDEIAAFADIGEHINQPVKTYSSGMFVRLAFAVQACTNPDILIVDEALSVGDIFFQQKCADRMRQLREQGTTLIFVSHDLALVRDLCQNALYLKEGKLIFYGPSKDALKHYYLEASTVKIPELPKNLLTATTSSSQTPQFKKALFERFKESACWVANDAESHDKSAKLLAISVMDLNKVPTMEAKMTGELKFQVLYQSLTERSVHIVIAFSNRLNHLIHSSGSQQLTLPPLKNGDYAIFELGVKCMLEAGSYTFFVTLGEKSDLPNRGSMVFDQSPNLGPLNITWDYEREEAPWFGMFGLPVEARILSIPN